MHILYSILAVVVVLAIVLPLFYIYIISRVRERLEKEVISSVRDEINALVREFNRVSLSNIGMLEHLTIRSKEILREVEKKEEKLKIKKTHSTDSNSSDLYKKNNSYISYNQELEIRNNPSYVSVSNSNLEHEIVSSNQEKVIFEMHNMGYSSQDIALKINRPVGEVELILSMTLGDYKKDES